MANVHTLESLNNNGGGGNGGGGGGGGRGGAGGMAGMQPADEESKQAAGMFGGLMGGGGADAGKPPREENYWDMWKTTFCPKFTPVSFTFLFWIMFTAVYVLTLCMMMSPNKELNPTQFLGPDLRTLHKWGALDAYEIRYNGQVWRLFTSLFLSVGFSVYCITSVALLVIGFIVENPKMSPYRMAIMFFGSGILGNLFSVCVQNEVSVGPMASIMSLTSGLLAGIIVNWQALAGAGMMRICLIFMSIFLFVIILLLSMTDDAGPGFESISMASEGGGFMVGIGMGMMTMPYALQRDSPYVKMVRKIGFALTFVFCIILFPVFFCAVEPRPTIWAD